VYLKTKCSHRTQETVYWTARRLESLTDVHRLSIGVSVPPNVTDFRGLGPKDSFCLSGTLGGTSVLEHWLRCTGALSGSSNRRILGGKNLVFVLKMTSFRIWAGLAFMENRSGEMMTCDNTITLCPIVRGTTSRYRDLCICGAFSLKGATPYLRRGQSVSYPTTR